MTGGKPAGDRAGVNRAGPARGEEHLLAALRGELAHRGVDAHLEQRGLWSRLRTAQEFGHEIRGISVADICDGKFTRWIDYWDGRHYGIAALKGFRSTPVEVPPRLRLVKAGSAYEWTNGHGPVPRGVSALQLGTRGQIVRMSSMWDGSLVGAAWLTRRMAETIESQHQDRPTGDDPTSDSRVCRGHWMGDLQKILVTGTTGNIGRTAAHELARRGITRPQLLAPAPSRGQFTSHGSAARSCPARK